MNQRSSRKPGGGRVTPKPARQSNAPSPPSGEATPAMLPVETLQNILGDVEHLRTADPLAIEIRSSFAWGLMQRSAGLELFRAVLATLNDGLRRGSSDARDYMRMLATVAETGVAKQFAQLLRQAAIVALPPRWVNYAGRAVVEQAYMYEYELGDTYTVNLICRYPGAEGRHELVAFIDTNFGWFVDIGAFGKASPIDDDLVDVRRHEISLDEARAHIERALGFAPALMDHPDAAKIVARLRLITHYIESLPQGFALAERQELADEQRDAIVEAFVESSHGQALAASPDFTDAAAVRELVQIVVVTAHDLLNGKPLRLTPQSASLLSMALRGSDLDDRQLAQLPAVLRAFVPYAHEENEWGDRFLAETMAAIDADQLEGRST
ncbi:MAG: hypothetical protein ABI658_18580 [Acidimicrobiales bacterium]